MDLPMGLISALESGNCVLFVGAGAGCHASYPDGSHAPDGATLAQLLAERFRIDVGDEHDLAKVSQVAQIRKGRPDVIAFLEKKLSDLEPDEHLRWLLSRTWRAVFTTNYDSVIERCYETLANPTQTPVSMGINSELQSFDPSFQVPIYHLHGSLFTTDAKDAILLTQQDYATFRERRSMLFDQLKVSYATTPILYFGYSNSDPNWREITAELRAQFSPASPPTAYRLVPATPPLDKEILLSQNITSIDGFLPDFRAEVEAKLGDIRVEPYQMQALAKRVPPDLQDLFKNSPAAVIRLLNSWEYVNQAAFEELPNTKEFLQGNQPNWSLIGGGLNFERDLEAPLVETLVEHATDPDTISKPQAHIILGPAGYGQTTLLMAVTAWFAKSRSGSALYLRSGQRVLEADIEFAEKYLPNQPIVLFIDNAADHADELEKCFASLRKSRSPAFLLLAERLNEWRQRRPGLQPVEHALEPLSDDEIDRLLERLTSLGSLGQLEPLSHDLRVSSIKVRNQQELLVTMREVTEGRAFDAIVEDEYRNIGSELGRHFYALVAIFSRARALARDNLCADALETNVADLYRELVPATEGIVVLDTVDESRGLYAARTRHHVIAEIVWRRCVEPGLRDHLFMRALESLNVMFGVDAKAFERFTRDDDAVDSLRGLEPKIRFFEAAVRKDPRNPYVRQHYARMLRREKRYDLALGQIEQALEMSPRARILHHTKGLVLKDLAVDASINEIARRRLAQSEESFNVAINMAPKDDYGYSSLADLYLDWARRTTSPDEAVAYVAKAQEVLFRGLGIVRQRESLYLIMSAIESFLQNTPARVEALRKALREAPASPIARYLLGSVLANSGDPTAEEVLREGVRLHPEHARLSVACALAIYRNGGQVDECVAILRLARNSGLDDSLFVSVFGGMLTLKGDLSEASSVWDRARQSPFRLGDRDRAGFTPGRPGQEPEWLDGRLVTATGGYGFVRVPGYADVFCPSHRLSSSGLKKDDRLQVRVTFTARGPVALQLRRPAEA